MNPALARTSNPRLHPSKESLEHETLTGLRCTGSRGQGRQGSPCQRRLRWRCRPRCRRCCRWRCCCRRRPRRGGQGGGEGGVRRGHGIRSLRLKNQPLMNKKKAFDELSSLLPFVNFSTTLHGFGRISNRSYRIMGKRPRYILRAWAE